ncbi:MAG: FAD-dependent oxidoreductase [Thermodesulfobacteriota bacterium]
MKQLSIEKIKTEVLVIGGGAAGLTAALEAKERGADVTIISKSRVGKSGNTIIAGTGMAILAPDPDSKDAPEIFRNDILRSGKEINDREMIDLHVAGTRKIIDKFAQWGVVLSRRDDRYMIKHTPGHSTARSFYTDIRNYPYLTKGLSLTLPQLRTARQRGVRIIDYAPVVALLLSERRIAGAAAVDKKEQKVLMFQSPAVVMAAGGGGMVYARNNNTCDVTGDSYALGYEAGAMLRDMEFVQFYPTRVSACIKFNISNAIFGEGAFLLNARGERFMAKYDRAGDMATRDVMTRAMFNEIAEGRGSSGNVFVDCRHLPKNVLAQKYAEFLRLLARVRIDPSRDLIPISPTTHFFMGGIAVNRRCETTVPGLLACGEAVGGLHGANRLAGNALSETYVFGMIAGNQAALLAKAAGVPEHQGFTPEPFRRGELSVAELRRALALATWKCISIIRDQRSIDKAVREIDDISASLDRARIESVYDLVSFYELKSMLATARLIALGAGRRKESRGAHYRSDYPHTDNSSYRGNFYLRNINGRLDVRFRPVS